MKTLSIEIKPEHLHLLYTNMIAWRSELEKMAPKGNAPTVHQLAYEVYDLLEIEIDRLKADQQLGLEKEEILKDLQQKKDYILAKY